MGKERVSRQFRPSFTRFIPRVVKYPVDETAALEREHRPLSVFGKYLNRGLGAGGGGAFSRVRRAALFIITILRIASIPENFLAFVLQTSTFSE